MPAPGRLSAFLSPAHFDWLSNPTRPLFLTDISAETRAFDGPTYAQAQFSHNCFGALCWGGFIRCKVWVGQLSTR